MEKLALAFSVLAFILACASFLRNKQYPTSDNEFDNDFYDAVPNIEDKRRMSSPYCLSIKNETKDYKTCVLFGLARYIHVKNYGSDEGLSVNMQTTPTHYIELLMQSGFKPFETQLLQFISKSKDQVSQIITITSKDANGQMVQMPLITQSYIKGELQADSDGYYRLEVPYVISVDCSTDLKLSILPNTELFVQIFPQNKVDVLRPSHNNYTPPEFDFETNH